MPINCPLNIDGSCEGCRNLYEGKCYWFFPSREIKDILTTQEQLAVLNRRVKELEENDIQNEPIYPNLSHLSQINKNLSQTYHF